MLFVVDANVVIAALISPSSHTNDLLFSPKIECVAPEFIEEEIKKYFSLIVSKSGIPAEDVLINMQLLFSRIRILSSSEYESLREKATRISPDPKDVEYIAVALAFNCPLWSNDKRLKSQESVRVFSTSELLLFLS